MKKLFAVTAVLALLCLGSLVQAAITIDTVAVGDPGNVGELSGAGVVGGNGPDRVCGSVSYNYNIGKYEVTAGQYTAFLNAVAKTDTYGLYNTSMSNTSSGSGIARSGSSGSFKYTVDAAFVNRPVNYVSYWDSCRFANWLGNGQKTGAQNASTTERGAYTLDGYTGTDGRTIQRNAGATWAVTSEDEWYKAAYYEGGGTNAGYWLYPTKSDTAPGNNMADPSGNNANYYTGSGSYPIDSGKYTTVVGEFQNSASAYGTFDQGGNVWEWNEAITYQDVNYAYRGLRGGSFNYSGGPLRSSSRGSYYFYPDYERDYVGFRVSQVPEPSSIIALLGGLVGLLGMRRRRG
jgi:formylglycine-generating enzyme